MNQEVVDRLLASGTDQEEYFKTTYTKMKILDIICLVLSFWCFLLILIQVYKQHIIIELKDYYF